jgi:DNA polymerase III epsilon subunit-like protein
MASNNLGTVHAHFRNSCGIALRQGSGMEVTSDQAGGAAAFAVVDLETTGLYPSKDRVVEIAVIQLNSNLEITGEFCTLIDPARDVGPMPLSLS